MLTSDPTTLCSLACTIAARRARSGPHSSVLSPTRSADRDRRQGTMTPEITIYGADWCGDCRRVKRYLVRNEIAYTWVDIEANPDEIAAVMKYNGVPPYSSTHGYIKKVLKFYHYYKRKQ